MTKRVSQRGGLPGAFVLAMLLCGGIAGQDNWPRFRGPNGAGVSSASSIPTTWTESDYNWIVDLPGVGHSSPTVWGSRIYLTSGEADSATRTVLCLHTTDGRTLWRRDYPSQGYKQHRDNCYATATPAADGEGVVIVWTTPAEVVLLALDPQGNQLWRRNLGPFVGPHGSGSSPIIVDDLVVLANDQEDFQLLGRLMGRENPSGPAGDSFLIAVERRTGETRWRLDRRTALAAYSTPCVRLAAGGRREIICTSTAHGITAVDLATGVVRWELGDVFADRCVGSPVLFEDLVIAGYGHGVRGSLCVAARSAAGGAPQEPSLAYEVRQSVPLAPTPLVKGRLLFLWADDGVVSCLLGDSGKMLWRERVTGAFYGSPVCVEDRLYCLAKNGDVVVLAAEDRYALLARIPLGEPSYSTPAVAAGVMYLRSRSKLFSLGGPAARASERKE